jgi:drug/metabolite transporter (DMT)-like permease
MTNDRTLVAVILIVCSTWLLSGMDAIGKLVSAQYSLWQIFTARSLVAVIILAVLLCRNAAPDWRRVGSPWVAARSALFAGMWIAYYVALPSTPLSLAAAALYTIPLFIALLSSVATKEPVGASSWAGIVLGFAGVLIALRPGGETFSPLALLPMLAAAFYALAAIITRTRLLAESPLVLALGLNVFLLMAGLAGTALVLFIGPQSGNSFLFGRWTAMGPDDVLLFAGFGAVMVAVALGVARAYQIGAPATVGAFDYTYLVFAVFWSILIFRETPDGWTLGGIAMIASAGVIVLWSSRHQHASLHAEAERASGG